MTNDENTMGIENGDGIVELSPQKRAWITRRLNEKRSNAAVKAWEVRKDVEIDGEVFRNFDLPRKNVIRNKLVDILKSEYHHKYPRNILALESPQCLFARKLPEFKIYAYEHNVDSYDAMCSNKPSNLIAYHGDISGAVYSDVSYYACFLDFCNTYKSNIDRIKKMQYILWNSKIVAFTFSMRGHKKDLLNHESDMIKKLNALLPSHLLEFCQSYRDGSTMMIVVFKKNPNVKTRKNRTRRSIWAEV